MEDRWWPMVAQANPTQTMPPLLAAIAAYRAARRRNNDRDEIERARAALRTAVDQMTAGPLLGEAVRATSPVQFAFAFAEALACDRLVSLVISLYFDDAEVNHADDPHAVPVAKQIESLVGHVTKLEQEIDKCRQRDRMSRPLRPR